MSDVGLEQSILSIALQDPVNAMELLSNTNIDYYSRKTQWLFSIFEHYFNDPNIRSIPTSNMVREYVAAKGGDPKNYVAEFERIYNLGVDPKEFKWKLDKLKLAYNAKLQDKIITRAGREFK